MTATFDLEQEILRCWGVTDDIELVYHSLESMTDDQRLNALLGLQTLYELKFEKTWKAFEAMCAERKAMQDRIAELEKSQNIDAMVDRFLGWPIPDTFSPDGGILFSPFSQDWKEKHRPTGTNILCATEAKAMFEYCMQRQK